MIHLEDLFYSLFATSFDIRRRIDFISKMYHQILRVIKLRSSQHEIYFNRNVGIIEFEINTQRGNKIRMKIGTNLRNYERRKIKLYFDHKFHLYKSWNIEIINE